MTDEGGRDDAGESPPRSEDGGPEPDPLTIKGQMEALGRLTGGLEHASPWQRQLLRAVVWFMVLTTIIGVVVIVVVASR